VVRGGAGITSIEMPRGTPCRGRCNIQRAGEHTGVYAFHVDTLHTKGRQGARSRSRDLPCLSFLVCLGGISSAAPRGGDVRVCGVRRRALHPLRSLIGPGAGLQGRGRGGGGGTLPTPAPLCGVFGKTTAVFHTLVMPGDYSHQPFSFLYWESHGFLDA